MKSTKFTLFFFTLQGIGALLSWNSLLTTLDFFSMKFKPHAYSFLVEIPFYTGNLIVGTALLFAEKKFDISGRIKSAISFLCILQIVLVFQAIYMPNELGFYINLCLAFLLGCCSIVYQSSSSGFVSRFPGECMSSYFSGTGLSGLLFNTVRLVLLATMGTSDKALETGSIIYFSFSSIFLIVCFLFFGAFIKTDFAKLYM